MKVGEIPKGARSRRGMVLGAPLLLVGFLAFGAVPARADLERLGADSLLAHLVRPNGLVDYRALGAERAALDRALRLAAEPSPKEVDAALPPAKRLAFYLNVYNLATLDLVAREDETRAGRLKSIQEIPAAWTRPRWKVLGVARTLNEIEHEILRKEFREPRIHMALVCASRSCPRLRPAPYTGDRLESQLEDASRTFVNDATRNEFAPRDGRIRISKIFDWYGGDFVGVYRDSTLERMYGEREGAVLAFAARYLPDGTAAALRAHRVVVDYLPYDWSLNAAPAATR